MIRTITAYADQTRAKVLATVDIVAAEGNTDSFNAYMGQAEMLGTGRISEVQARSAFFDVSPPPAIGAPQHMGRS